MVITNSSKEDLPEIFRLYKLATDIQKIKFPDSHWPEFDNLMVTIEVLEKKQYKLLIENRIACIWAITYSDPKIWETDDGNSAVYIHRIAADPIFRGEKFVKIIADWAIGLARDQNRRFIRMDTCGKNDRLITHYTDCGFRFLGIKKLKCTLGLPSHYKNSEVCFFEIAL